MGASSYHRITDLQCDPSHFDLDRRGESHNQGESRMSLIEKVTAVIQVVTAIVLIWINIIIYRMRKGR